MSQENRSKYEEVPASEVQSVADDSQRAADGGRVVFWAPASKHQIANRQKEIKNSW